MNTFSKEKEKNKEKNLDEKEILETPTNDDFLFRLAEDSFFIVSIMIFLFFINIYFIIKNQIKLIAEKIVKRIWHKIINHPPLNDLNEKYEINHYKMNNCSICLNNLKFGVSVTCFHVFCGIF